MIGKRKEKLDTRKNKSTSLLVFLFCIILSGTISIYFGKDLSWDLANYHYYNPYAFLNNRASLDYWPISFIHLFFFPTADFISYFLINHLKPFTVVFLMGALQGLNIWLTYLIAHQFIQKRSLAILMALLGTYSALIFSKLGGFENDHLMSIFILGFIYLQIRILHDGQVSRTRISMNAPITMMSGFCLGFALGLKLTAGIYIIGAMLANIFIPMILWDRMKYFFILIMAVACSFLITSGYFMFILWHKYHNPVFPFFNGIFHSPYFPAINFHYELFLPKTLLEKIFYPFYFSFNGSEGDQKFTDLRFVITFLLFIIFGIKCLYLKLRNKSDFLLTLREYWLFVFIIFSYVIWEYYFAIVRYISIIAFLAPLIIYLLVIKLIERKSLHFYILFFLYLYMVVTMSSTIIIRAPWYRSDYFNVKIPPHIIEARESLVLIAYPAFALSNQPKPQSYLIPFFPKHWRFIGIPFDDIYPAHLEPHECMSIKRIINEHHDAIFLLATDSTIQSFYSIAKQFGLIPNGACASIMSDRQQISNCQTYICPVKKELRQMPSNLP